LQDNAGSTFTAESLASALGEDTDIETTYKLLCSLAAKPNSPFQSQTASSFFDTKFLYSSQ